jgi:hypothetical protein
MEKRARHLSEQVQERKTACIEKHLAWKEIYLKSSDFIT